MMAPDGRKEMLKYCPICDYFIGIVDEMIEDESALCRACQDKALQKEREKMPTPEGRPRDWTTLQRLDFLLVEVFEKDPYKSAFPDPETRAGDCLKLITKMVSMGHWFSMMTWMDGDRPNNDAGFILEGDEQDPEKHGNHISPDIKKAIVVAACEMILKKKG